MLQAENVMEPGARSLSEIREQPAALVRLLEQDGEAAQLFAGALARARGLDSDAPHGLAKVTLAR